MFWCDKAWQQPHLRLKEGVEVLVVPAEVCIVCLRQVFCQVFCPACNPDSIVTVLDCSGAGGAAVMADDVARMPAEAVFLRRQAYGPALGVLFRAGAADAKSLAHAKLLRLISLWVSTLLACKGRPMAQPAGAVINAVITASGQPAEVLRV